MRFSPIFGKPTERLLQTQAIDHKVSARKFALLINICFAFLLVASGCGKTPEDTAQHADGYCEPNLAGTAEASEEIRDIYHIDTYQYELDKETNEIIVTPKSSDGEPLGTFHFRMSDDTLFRLNDLPHDIFGSEVVASFEMPDDHEKGVRMRVTPTVKVDAGNDVMTYTARLDQGDKELLIETIMADTSTVKSISYSVLSSQDAEAPSVGYAFDGTWGIFIDPKNPAPEVETWFQEVDRVDFMTSEAMELMMAMLAEQTWLQTALDHLVECTKAEFESQSQEKSLHTRGQRMTFDDIDRCVGAVGAIGAGVGLVAGTAALCIAPDPTFLTKVGCVAGFTSAAPAGWNIAKKTTECVCGSEKANFFNNCPNVNTCDSSACAERCSGEFQQPCAGGGETTGECREVASYIFDNKQRCVCVTHLGDLPPCDCKAGCSKGDPHLISLDGLAYNFQGAGEFILAEALQGPTFVVQARQTSMGSVCGGVAANTALATSNGSTWVSVDVKQDPPIRIGGVPIENNKNEYELEGGILRKLTPSQFVVHWSSGEQVKFELYGSHVDINITLPPQRYGQVRGLLGTYSGSTDDDITTRDGVVLTQPVDWERFYEIFGDSWRINQEESLFHYENGKNTSDYTLSNYPMRPTSIGELPETVVSNATRVCENAGVSDEVWLDACVVDVACTGEEDYAASAGTLDTPNRVLNVIQPIFLDGWAQEGEVTNGNWEVDPNGRSVTQKTNGDPTFFISKENYFNTRIRGTFEVATSSDDDFIGFVFGYQSPLAASGDAANEYKTFLLSWKKYEQSTGGYHAEEGFTLAYIDGVVSDIEATFWGHEESPSYKVLGTNYGEERGWRDQQEIAFELEYRESRIRIWIDDELIFDITPQQAGTIFEPGRFGFYNYSQKSVIYSNFSSEN